MAEESQGDQQQDRQNSQVPTGIGNIPGGFGGRGGGSRWLMPIAKPKNFWETMA